MARVFFEVGKQREFLEKVKDRTTLGWSEMAELCGICRRSLTDWKREKLHASLRAVKNLERLSGVRALHIKKIEPEHWQIATREMARRGGLSYKRKYGNPGTVEGRRRGGFKRLKISYPRKSAKLAEFVGIMLGDGGVTQRQISITLHSDDDREYAEFIVNLIGDLFQVKPGVCRRRDRKSISLQVSRVNLVEFFMKIGFRRGNKIKQRVDLPPWIKRRKRLRVACLRGLIDTDGSVFTHRYKVNGKRYSYKKLCFTSYSRPLLESAGQLLFGLGFAPKFRENDLYLYNESEVKRYFREIGTHNPKHWRRFLN